MSVSMTLIRGLLALDPRRRRIYKTTGAAAIADPARTDAAVPPGLRRRYAVSESRIGERLVTRVAPRDAAPVAEVVYYHGGGYVEPVQLPHWWIVGELVARSGAAVTIPSYPLAPEHHLDDVLPWFDEVFAQAVARGRRLVLAGDSAGGALAVVQAIRARDAGQSRADHLVLYSPWVDATLANPDARALEPQDVLLRCDGLALDGRSWAGGRSLSDRLVSPINDSLADLPAMSIFQGTHDILFPDVAIFAEKARAAGTAVEFTLAKGAFHVYVAVPWTPEGTRALAASASVIRG